MAECAAYSVRMLSPFRGMLQIVETGDARAFSTDGVAWQIQVRCEHRRVGWGGRDRGEAVMRRAVCGVWTAKRGLKQFPLDPTVDVQAVRAQADMLAARLAELAAAVPFGQRDTAELWLLDRDTRAPLALAASATPDRDLSMPGAVVWQPSTPGANGYHRAVPGTGNGAGPDASTRWDDLAERVRRLAGPPPHARWYRRTADGGGVAADNHGDVPAGQRRLPREAFPELLLRDAWRDEADQRLADRYFEWQAPLLLTLPHLSEEARGRLERAARRQALSVQAVHRLYPSVVNGELISAALVEAGLRAAAS